MAEQPLISVIIPVYNTEKYLDRCVTSVVDQTYKNLEIILVDDGSPDRCPEMCDEWAKNDTRIKVIHKENGGAADAKNAGLDLAGGEFISLIDSDDMIAPEMLNDLLRLINEYKADIADSLIKKVCTEDEISNVNNDVNVTVYDTTGALRQLISNKTVRQTPVNKLYKKSVIDNILFPKGKYIDDEYWTYKVIGNSKKYVFTSAVYYFYFQHSESAMGRDYSLKRLDVLDALKERAEYIKDNFPSIFNEAEASYLRACRFHFQMLCYHKELDPEKEHRKEIINRINSIDIDSTLKAYKGKQLMWLKAFLKTPYFTSRLRNIFKIGW